MLRELLKEKLNKVKPEKGGEPVSSKEYFPNIYLKAKDLPEIKEWEVGEDYYLLLKVTMRSKEEYETSNEERCSASFDIKEIGSVEGKNKMEDEEDEYEDEDSELTKAQLMKKYGK